jgi:DNA-directed RNA polymerase specialized sigma24 family protein
VFLKAWGAFSTLREPAAFKSWLYSIAVNESKNALRSRKNNVSLEEEQARTFTERPDPGPSIEELVLGKPQPLLEAVKETARNTKPPWDDLDYAIFHLYYGVGEENFEEIARAVGTPSATVRSRVMRHIKPVIQRVAERFRKA